MSTRALPGQPCQTPPRPEWTDPEKWVWQQVCEGKIADFNSLHEEKPDPRDSDDWSPERLISPLFLETILLHDPFQNAVPRQGVRIIGAWLTEPLDLQDARLAHPWRLEKSRVDAEVRLSRLESTHSISFKGSMFTTALNLARAKVGGVLSLIGAKVTGTLDMNGLEVGGDLFMRNGAEFKDVDLLGAQVGGQLDLSGAKVTGTLDMGSLEVGSSLFMRDGAAFGDVVLRSAQVGGVLDLSGAKCTGTLNMDKLAVGSSLFMREGAEFAGVVLRSAKIGGQLDLSGAKVTGTLNMEMLAVGSSLFMRDGAKFGEAVHLVFATIGSALDLSGAKLSSLEMTGTRVQGELRLGSGTHSEQTWHKKSRLILRNAAAGAMHDSGEEGDWPKHLDLNGFTYTHLGGLQSGEGGSDMAARKAKWFIKWLEKDQTYTPQPYHQLTNVLYAMGRTKAVNAILYAGKERERQEAGGRKWWGLSLLSWTIGYGYGYRYFRSLRWVAAITLIGVLVLATVDCDASSTLAQKAAFSFDLLLPIIELDERHKIMFEGWQRYYFYVHQLMGFVLGSFVVAGLSGITKK